MKPPFTVMAMGEHVKDCTLVVRRKSDGTEAMKYVIHNILISSYKVSGVGSAYPIEEVSFDFDTMDMEYKSKAGNSSAKASHDGKASSTK